MPMDLGMNFQGSTGGATGVDTTAYRRFLNEMPVGITVFQDGLLRFVNVAAQTLFRRSAAELESRSVLELVDATDRPRLIGIHRRWLREGTLPGHCVLRASGDEGAARHWRVALNGVEWEGRPAVLAAISDISEQVRARDEMRRLALHDPLTGLPNRLLLEDRIHQAIAAARRKGKGIALLFLDLDGFKPINDSMGHRTGDDVLREIAGRLRGCMRASDTVARVGGDEFVVLVQDVDNRCECLPVARKLVEAVGHPVSFPGGEATLGVSAGLSFYPEDGQDRESLMRVADASMYLAKRAGRNQVRCATCDQAFDLAGPGCG